MSDLEEMRRRLALARGALEDADALSITLADGSAEQWAVCMQEAAAALEGLEGALDMARPPRADPVGVPAGTYRIEYTDDGAFSVRVDVDGRETRVRVGGGTRGEARWT